MKKLIFVLSMVALTACSDPPGWILWGHTYSTRDGRPSGDDWESYESFFKMTECKNQIQTEIATRARYWEETKKEKSKDVKITIQQEKESLKLTQVRLLANKQETSSVSVSRFYCMPLGVDPRPKDQSTWILWEKASASQGGKTVETTGWSVAEGYLTKTACEAASYSKSEFQREMDRDITEKQPDNPSKRTVQRYYSCLPVGVRP